MAPMFIIITTMKNSKKVIIIMGKKHGIWISARTLHSFSTVCSFDSTKNSHLIIEMTGYKNKGHNNYYVKGCDADHSSKNGSWKKIHVECASLFLKDSKNIDVMGVMNIHLITLQNIIC